MDYRDILSAELPPPRDDEPAGMRQDIVDELADHLTCAYHHELIRGSDASAARARALERFGDPAAVARRLWLDAIGGKVMVQRVFLATCLVVTLGSLTLIGVMSHQRNQAQFESARATVEAIRALQAQTAKSQANQQEMVNQLHAMSEAIRSPRSFDWNPVSVELTEGTANGPPVADASVRLSEQGMSGAAPGGGARTIARQTDGSGIVDFGVVHPGQYSLWIQKRWRGEGAGEASTECSLTVEPGSLTRKKIVCPKLPLPHVPVRIRADWPAELARKGLVLYARFALKPLGHDDLLWNFHRYAVVERWSAGRMRGGGMGGGMAFSGLSHSALYGPRSSLTEIPHTQSLYFWGNASGSNIWADLRGADLHEITEQGGTLAWEQGSYRLVSLLALRPQPVIGGDGRKHFAILAATFPALARNFGGDRGLIVDLRDSPPSDEDLALGPATPGVSADGLIIKLPEEYWAQAESAFEARPGATNDWVIPLPDELIERVRTAVNAAPKEPEGG